MWEISRLSKIKKIRIGGLQYLLLEHRELTTVFVFFRWSRLGCLRIVDHDPGKAKLPSLLSKINIPLIPCDALSLQRYMEV